MKNLITFFVIIVINFTSKGQITMRILNKSLKNNEMVNVLISNKSAIDYCLVIDNLFYLSNQSYIGTGFNNLQAVIIDKKNICVDKVREIKEYDRKSIPVQNNFQTFENDTLKVFVSAISGSKLLKLLKIGAKSSVVVKVPFNLVLIDMIKGEREWYDIKKQQKYVGQTFYSINSKFIKNNFVVAKLDSLANKKMKIYTGTIFSNKVPLIIKN